MAAGVLVTRLLLGANSKLTSWDNEQPFIPAADWPLVPQSPTHLLLMANEVAVLWGYFLFIHFNL